METRCTQITQNCGPSQRTWDPWTLRGPYWLAKNITTFIAHTNVRGRQQSWMFPSWNSSGVVTFGRMTSSTCNLCGWKRIKITKECKGGHGLGIILLSLPRQFLLNSQWRAGKMDHLEKKELHDFDLCLPEIVLQEHMAFSNNHCHFPLLSNDSQINFSYMVM